MPFRLPTSISPLAASRTWATEPGALDSSPECSVWTESTTQAAGRSASIAATTAPRSVSASTGTARALSPSRSARIRTWAADSSPVT